MVIADPPSAPAVNATESCPLPGVIPVIVGAEGAEAAEVTVPVTAKSSADELALSKMYHAPPVPAVVKSTHRKVTVVVAGRFWSAVMPLREVLPIAAPLELVLEKLTVAISTKDPELI